MNTKTVNDLFIHARVYLFVDGDGDMVGYNGVYIYINHIT